MVIIIKQFKAPAAATVGGRYFVKTKKRVIMQYKRYGDKIVLRLCPGEEILSSIKSVCKAEGVFAASLSGIGATDDFTVGVFDMNLKDYERFHFDGNHEINSLIGNVTEKDGEPYIHLHLTATGKDGRVVGGHLIGGTISLTAEIFIDVLGVKLSRVRDENLAINLIDVK